MFPTPLLKAVPNVPNVIAYPTQGESLLSMKP